VLDDAWEECLPRVGALFLNALLRLTMERRANSFFNLFFFFPFDLEERLSEILPGTLYPLFLLLSLSLFLSVALVDF